MRPTLFIVTALAAALLVPVAAAQTVDPEFTKARAARNRALENGDAATFAHHTAERFIVSGGGRGELEDKAQRVARHTAQGPRPVYEDERIIPYGDDMVILSWRQKGQNGASRTMEVWVKEDGVWKCAAVQISRIDPR
jgi:hypothetical protein